jgi:hypothetical protein
MEAVMSQGMLTLQGRFMCRLLFSACCPRKEKIATTNQKMASTERQHTHEFSIDRIQLSPTRHVIQLLML